ncbi:hypothetical protein [Hymenobacter rubidus]|uniref:hypothetical protein n=1 Tax=Hymenobacter rubidus TaxID=1441626 RepID=UPI00191D2BF4|nr:hypothetical protein [Hymenobacter rubidus]
MKLRYLLLGLGLISTGAHAQILGGVPMAQRDYSSVSSNEYANINELTKGATHLLTRRPNLIGSPFAEDKWLIANVLMNNKLSLRPMLLKYDVLEHRLIMRQPEPSQDSIELDDRQVASFVLNEPASNLGPARQRLFRRFEEAPRFRQRDYVEVLHEGRYALLKHYQKKIKSDSFQGFASNGIPPDEIVDESLYYLRTPEGTLTPVKLSLKALQTAAPALSDALKTAAAKKPRTEAEWSAVLNAADPAK